MKLLPTNIILRQLSASLTFCGSLSIILTFFICKPWRIKQRGIKSLLLVMSFFDLLSSINYFYYPLHENDNTCALQSLFIQLFQVGAWLYRAFLALETAIILNSIVSLKKDARKSVVNANTNSVYNWRYMMYHFIGNSYTISSGIYLLSRERYGFSSSLKQFWCWWRHPFDRLYFGFTPLWISTTMNICCNSYTIYTLKSLNMKKPIFWRLAIESLAFVIFLAPSSIRSFFTAIEVMTVDEALKIAPVEAMFAMIQGFVNFFIWIVFDESVVSFYRENIKILLNNIMGVENASYFFSDSMTSSFSSKLPNKRNHSSEIESGYSSNPGIDLARAENKSFVSSEVLPEKIDHLDTDTDKNTDTNIDTDATINVIHLPPS